MLKIPLRFKRLCPEAQLPQYSRDGDACLDIASAANRTILPGCQAVIFTGLTVEVPVGYEMQVRGRSGLALKGVWAFEGTIDSNYRGEILIILRNHGCCAYHVLHGDRVAQLAVRKAPEFAPVWADELTETTRGDAGFGSSGL